MQNVDRFHKMNVSALVAPSNGTILVLHSEGKPSDDAIKHFLFDVSDLYMKVRSSCSAPSFLSDRFSRSPKQVFQCAPVCSLQ